MPGPPNSPATEAVLTMAPRPCFSITGSTWRMPRNTPFRLTPITASNIASSYSWVGAALPFDAGVVEEAVDRAVGIERRLHIVLHVGGLGDIGATRSAHRRRADAPVRRLPRPSVASKSTTTTLAPRPAKPIALARPMPPPPPVINATLPANSICVLSLVSASTSSTALPERAGRATAPPPRRSRASFAPRRSAASAIRRRSATPAARGPARTDPRLPSRNN